MLTKDESSTKRASVRRINPRAKLTRAVVKATVVPTPESNTQIIEATTPEVLNEGPVVVSSDRTTVTETTKVPEAPILSVDDIIGPVTRSKNCRLCMNVDPNEDNNNNSSGNENNIKRGKRSLSNSRLHEKKNKLSRKAQSLTIGGIGCGTSCIPTAKKLLKSIAPTAVETDSQQSEVEENDENACDVQSTVGKNTTTSSNSDPVDTKNCNTKSTISNKLFKKR